MMNSKTNRSLTTRTAALALALALSAASGPASALDGVPTDQELCRMAADAADLYMSKIETCDLKRSASVRRVEEGRTCEEQLANCKPSTKRWMKEYYNGFQREIEPAPQCTGDGRSWMQDYLAPAGSKVMDELGTVPVDRNCGFLGMYGVGIWGQANINLSGNVNIPSRIDVNVDIFGRGSHSRSEAAAPPPPTPSYSPPPPPSSYSPPPPPQPPPPPTQVESAPDDSNRPFILQPNGGPSRRFHISALGAAGGYAGAAFGVGGLIGTPIRTSFIPVLNDALHFEAGARMTFVNYGNNTTGSFLTLLAGVRWDIYFSRAWSVYTAARTSPAISFSGRTGQLFVLGGAAGVHWRFVDALGLRLEVDGSNFGGSINAGVTLFF